MKIGIVAQGLALQKIGGAERQALEFAEQMSLKHDVTVFTERNGFVRKEYDLGNVRVVEVPVIHRKFLWPLSFLARVSCMARAVRRAESRPDVLICFSLTPGGLIGALVKKGTGIPFCTWVQGADWNYSSTQVSGRAIHRRVIGKADAVVALTGSMGEEIAERFPAAQVSVIPIGKNLSGRTRCGDSLVFVGNLLRRKGAHVLIEAVRGLPDIETLIVGDGPERAMLEEKAEGLHVRFAGQIPHDKVVEFMADNGKILVCPSIGPEGIPNVIIEAMSIGLPVIASRVKGIEDVLLNADGGLLVEPGNADALALAIKAIWDDDTQLRRMSTAGTEAASEYSWNTVVKQWEKLLSQVVGI